MLTDPFLFGDLAMTTNRDRGLLVLMRMFDRQEIPEDLVNQYMGRLNFEDAVAPLISSSLM
jgi:hypothetical protein